MFGNSYKHTCNLVTFTEDHLRFCWCFEGRIFVLLRHAVVSVCGHSIDRIFLDIFNSSVCSDVVGWLGLDAPYRFSTSHLGRKLLGFVWNLLESFVWFQLFWKQNVTWSKIDVSLNINTESNNKKGGPW